MKKQVSFHFHYASFVWSENNFDLLILKIFFPKMNLYPLKQNYKRKYSKQSQIFMPMPILFNFTIKRHSETICNILNSLCCRLNKNISPYKHKWEVFKQNCTKEMILYCKKMLWRQQWSIFGLCLGPPMIRNRACFCINAVSQRNLFSWSLFPLRMNFWGLPTLKRRYWFKIKKPIKNRS